MTGPTKIRIKDVSSRHGLEQWLSEKPSEFSSILAVRSAIRASVFAFGASPQWIKKCIVTELRALLVTWTATSGSVALTGRHISEPAALTRIVADGSFSLSRVGGNALMAAARALNSLTTQRVISHRAAADAAGFATSAAFAAKFNNAAIFWKTLENDCSYLIDQMPSDAIVKNLIFERLWLDDVPASWTTAFQNGADRLLDIDPNFDVWLDWLDRRFRGEQSAFGISGDEGQIEDKKILHRLTEATDEDFWGKGHEYVNATLKSWIEEARERDELPVGISEERDEALGLSVALPVPPPQELGATTYYVTNEGILDRLSYSSQKHLRDTPEQRRSYDDIREAANLLFDENQRLGPRLHASVERLCTSLPERFEEAQTYLVWRDGNALRRLYLAHRKVEARNEPDEARLEAVVAEMLGGLLDLYNVFAFSDDGLRAKDEDRITLQERADGKAEATASAPIIRALLDTSGVTSEATRNDIHAEIENSTLPADDPYSDQALDQSNRINRNLVAGILQWIGENVGNPNTFPGAVAVGVSSGAVVAGGSALLSAASGTNFVPLMEFVAAQASVLQNYVSIAYSSYPHLPELIERAKTIWNQFRRQ